VRNEIGRLIRREKVKIEKLKKKKKRKEDKNGKEAEGIFVERREKRT